MSTLPMVSVLPAPMVTGPVAPPVKFRLRIVVSAPSVVLSAAVLLLKYTSG